MHVVYKCVSACMCTSIYVMVYVTGDDLHAMLMQMKESLENYTW